MQYKNQFKTICKLDECRIEIYSTFIKMKLSCKIKQHIITFYYNINARYNKKQYDYILSNLNCLHTTIDCNVYYDDKIYDVITAGNNTLLYLSGNICEKNNNIYFNAAYIQFLDATYDEYLDIIISGICIDSNTVITKLNNYVKIFNIPNNLSYRQYATFYLSYQFNNDIIDNIIYDIEKSSNFIVNNIELSDYIIDDNEFNNMLLEIEIEELNKKL